MARHHKAMKYILNHIRILIVKYFAKQALKELCMVFKERKLTNHIFIWHGFENHDLYITAFIRDDDEITENILILSEAKVNSVYHKYGISVHMEIFEDSEYPHHMTRQGGSVKQLQCHLWS